MNVKKLNVMAVHYITRKYKCVCIILGAVSLMSDELELHQTEKELLFFHAKVTFMGIACLGMCEWC